jgi:hypothetical protein
MADRSRVHTDDPAAERARLLQYMRDSRNWGRWREHPERGALNLITDRRRRAAVALVTTGTCVSLARPVPQTPSDPADYVVRTERITRSGGGGVIDQFTLGCHGLQWTHLDSLCHAWDDDGMWEGRNPDDVIAPTGVRWAGVQHWSQGVITRGVLLDVPAFRGEPYVRLGEPVSGAELDDVARRQGVDIAPGDAVVVYSGRDAWERAQGRPYGHDDDPRAIHSGRVRRPGLDVSCLQFLRDCDCSILVWDMMDALPSRLGVPWPVHAALYLYGVGLVDNALLEPLAQACADQGRYEFMLCVAPLNIVGATGSPVNPLACF